MSNWSKKSLGDSGIKKNLNNECLWKYSNLKTGNNSEELRLNNG